jgi:hypothetical protein
MNTTDASSIFDTGSIIDGKWVLIERIGKGGMGEVHRAHQLNLKRDVAIKLISKEFLLDVEDNPEEVETLRARFQREVQVMAQVRHPNVLQIFDYGSVIPQPGAPLSLGSIRKCGISHGTRRRVNTSFYGCGTFHRKLCLDALFPIIGTAQGVLREALLHGTEWQNTRLSVLRFKSLREKNETNRKVPPRALSSATTRMTS